MRTSLGLLLAAFSLCAPADAGVLVVDRFGLGDFTALQPAVDAAADGDVILVRAGSYSADFTVVDKDLRIFGAGEATEIGGEGLAWFRDLAAGKALVVSDATLGDTYVSDCAGAVRFERCTFRPSQFGYFDVERCDDIVLVDSIVLGGVDDQTHDGSTALTVRSSFFALHDSTIQGSRGLSGNNHAPAGRGGTALRVVSSDVYIARSTFFGGDGGSGRACTSAQTCQCAEDGANGGHGAVVDAGSNVHHTDALFLGGAGGAPGTNCVNACEGAHCGFLPPPQPGNDGVATSGTLAQLASSIQRGVRSAGSPILDDTEGELLLRFRGQAGDEVFLAGEEATALTFDLPHLGAWSLDPPGNVPMQSVGTIGASGVLDVSAPVRPRGPGEESATFYQQAWFVPADGTTPVLSSPATALRVPAECGFSLYCSASPNSSGSGAQLGARPLGAAVVRFDVESVPASVPGLFFVGLQQVSVPFGDGTRCVGGPTRRLHPVVTTTQSGFVDNFDVDLGAAPFDAPPFGTDPGSALNFQFWYRDPLGPGGAGFNLSSAARFAFCP